MARPTDLAARHALVDEIVEYLAEHGLAETTLRPLATALSTTAPRLLHHFGSKEQMIAVALERLESSLRQIEARWLAREPDLGQSDLLRLWWNWLLGSHKNLRLVRLSLEAAILDPSITGLDHERRAAQMGAWRQNIERRLLSAGYSEADSARQSSALEAAFTGLMIDLLSGGDAVRLSGALEWVLEDHDRRIAGLTPNS